MSQGQVSASLGQIGKHVQTAGTISEVKNQRKDGILEAEIKINIVWLRFRGKKDESKRAVENYVQWKKERKYK